MQMTTDNANYSVSEGPPSTAGPEAGEYIPGASTSTRKQAQMQARACSGAHHTHLVTMGEVVADVYLAGTNSVTDLPLLACPGGAPAHVAVAARRLGARATLVGSVGQDLFGEFIIGALRGAGVSTAVRRSPEPARTSLAFVKNAADDERTFTFYRTEPAADDLLHPDDVLAQGLEGASYLTFGSIPLGAEPSRSAIHTAVDLAHELSVPVVFDANLRLGLWSSLKEARDRIVPLLRSTDIVKLSDDELGPLLDTESVQTAADRLLNLGASLVLITRGSRGALYATARFRGEVPAFPVSANDATGAGDAFLAAFLVSLDDHTRYGARDGVGEKRVRQAVQRGAAAGALACTVPGAITAMPGAEEVDSLAESRATAPATYKT